jgi:hypothetical protein
MSEGESVAGVAIYGNRLRIYSWEIPKRKGHPI